MEPISYEEHKLYPYPHIPCQLLFCAWPITLLKITDRLYLASYINPPTEDTLFPYPEPPPLRSPTKRSQQTPQPALKLKSRKQPYYFTVDDQLFYNAFHHDFGPFHIGHLYRSALMFHDILGAKENRDRPVVFWSLADPKSMY
jgi:cell division cycle 14